MDRHKINITIPVGTFNSPTLLASFIWRIFFLLLTVLPVRDFIVLFKQETWIHNLHFDSHISILTERRRLSCQQPNPREMFYQLTFHLMVQSGNVSDIFDQGGSYLDKIKIEPRPTSHFTLEMSAKLSSVYISHFMFIWILKSNLKSQ